MDSAEHFQPFPSLLEDRPHPVCRAVVIIPARNEEAALPATLNALRLQVNSHGTPLDHDLYEVIVLLNNCTDASSDVVRKFQQTYPTFHLHCAERSLAAEIAHVGTARRMLMDTAYHRLSSSTHPHTVILSTDADTTVAPDWISRNLRAIEDGAEVVGGVIHLKPEDIGSLDAGTLQAYRADRRYQRNVARLESLLDPDAADPWPRHLEHFGASLACTPAIYARAGGLPPVSPLEDVAFIDALRRVDARIRHAPDVSIVTSARLEGRAEVGLSWQLRQWQKAALTGESQMVDSAAWLAHRFSSMALLRKLRTLPTLPSATAYPRCWREPLLEVHPQGLSTSAFFCAIDCDRLINETFRGIRRGSIVRVTADLGRAITRLTRTHSPVRSSVAEPASMPVPVHPAENVPVSSTAPYATPAG